MKLGHDSCGGGGILVSVMASKNLCQNLIKILAMWITNVKKSNPLQNNIYKYTHQT